MNSWVPLCSTGFLRRESNHRRLNRIYARLGRFQGTSTWKCPNSSTSASQRAWETVLSGTSTHGWATALLYLQLTNSSPSVHCPESPEKHTKPYELNHEIQCPLSRATAAVSTDQSRTLQNCSEHRCNSFCSLCWGCLFTAEVLRAERCHQKRGKRPDCFFLRVPQCKNFLSTQQRMWGWLPGGP